VNLGEHAGFIIAAYAVVSVVVVGLVAWIVADFRVQKRVLAELEKRSPRRTGGGNT
jgi:heme exporter protein CcmD